MPLPDRIKRKDSITGIAIGVDGELILEEGNQIKFNWLYDGLWNQQTLNGKPVISDMLSITIAASSRRLGGDPISYDLDREDLVFLNPPNLLFGQQFGLVKTDRSVKTLLLICQLIYLLFLMLNPRAQRCLT